MLKQSQRIEGREQGVSVASFFFLIVALVATPVLFGALIGVLVVALPSLAVPLALAISGAQSCAALILPLLSHKVSYSGIRKPEISQSSPPEVDDKADSSTATVSFGPGEPVTIVMGENLLHVTIDGAHHEILMRVPQALRTSIVEQELPARSSPAPSAK
jgi:hypothetical protein